MGETARVLTKPRLTYDYHTHILTINMLSVLREVSFDHMKGFIGKSINAFLYDCAVIDLTIRMTWLLEIKDGSVTPDMIITVTAMEGPTEVLLIPFYGKCALTETDEHVFGRAEKVILVHSNILCVVVILVREATEYASLDGDSATSNILHGDTDGGCPQPHSSIIHQETQHTTYSR